MFLTTTRTPTHTHARLSLPQQYVQQCFFAGHRLVIGCYTYLDGALFVRLAMAADLVTDFVCTPPFPKIFCRLNPHCLMYGPTVVSGFRNALPRCVPYNIGNGVHSAQVVLHTASAGTKRPDAVCAALCSPTECFVVPDASCQEAEASKMLLIIYHL